MRLARSHAARLLRHLRPSVRACGSDPRRPSKRSSATSSSAARRSNRADAAGGLARTTSRLPRGRRWRRSRIRCRSRRFTRFLVTAPPTARLTTNPTRGGVSSSSRLFMCTTRVRRPARSPRRIATAKSSPRRIRDPDGNTEDLPMDLGQVRLSPGRHRQRCRKRTGDEACLGGEDRGPSRGDRQTASLARPLRRRAAMIARPARVRMRSRKPWVFARRRLFGW